MNYGDKTTGFNMDEEFVGSHIDENGFISFTKQKTEKKLTKKDQIYGIWNEEVETNIFQGQKKLAKTTLAMNFRKSGQIQHDPDGGIKVKQALAKQSQIQQKTEITQKTQINKQGQKVESQTTKVQKKSVRFDESNLKENEINKEKKRRLKQFGFDKEIDPLQYDMEEQEEIENDGEDELDDRKKDLISQKQMQKNKYLQMLQKGIDDDDDEDNIQNDLDSDEQQDDEQDEDDEGFSKGRKNKLFFKSTSSKKNEKNNQKSILRKKSQFESSKQKKDYNDDLDDLDDLGEGEDDVNQYEDQDEKFKFSKSLPSAQIHLTKDQMRKKKIFNFKRNKEDDDDTIFEEQTKQFNLPLKFGQQRKQFKKKTDQEIEEESKNVVNLETKEEMNMTKEYSESYGKGFEMLKKMGGYKVGKGLGKDEKGRSKPIEANFKQSFTMHDNYQQMEKENKRLLKEEFNIDVEEEIDQFYSAYDDFKKNKQDQFQDYDEENTIEFEKTYVKTNNDQKKFPNKFFAHLNKKSRQAKQGSLTDITAIQEQIKSDSSLQSNSNIGSNSQMKIIDMRSGSHITYDSNKGGNNYSEFFAANKVLDVKALAKTENPIFGQMLFNLKNKLDKIKSKKVNLSQKLKIESDRIVTVQYEEKQLIEQANKHKNKMDQTIKLLNKLQFIRQNDIDLSTSELLSTFIQLFEGCENQFSNFNLEQLLVKLIAESIKRQFDQLALQNSTLAKDSNSEEEIDLGDQYDEYEGNNKQLSRSSSRIQQSIKSMNELNKQEVEKSVSLIQKVKKLLTKIFLFKQNENLMQYESGLQVGNIHLTRDTVLNEKNSRSIERYIQYIINNSLMPHFKNFMMRKFEPTNLKSNNEAIDCMEEYQKILPKSSIQDIIQSYVLPKLNDSVKKWNPVKNERRNLQNDVDLWLLPWLTLIQPIDLLKDTFKLVLAKYSQVLVKWEVQDRSMLDKLKPWKNIISESQWNDLMIKQIIPKLQFYLIELEINPSDQKDLDVLQNIVDWCDLISEKDICNIMEDTILVKLAEVLMEWLSSEDADKQEIKSWLSSWESILGNKIMSIETFSFTFASFFDKVDEV